MTKLNEVSKYLLDYGWYAKVDKTRWSDNEDYIRYINLDQKAFEIEIYYKIKTKEITKVNSTIYVFSNGRTHLDEVYNRAELLEVEEAIKIIKKGLDKIDNELLKPMCKKFNLPFVDEESFGGRDWYLDVKDIEEWLKNE